MTSYVTHIQVNTQSSFGNVQNQSAVLTSVLQFHLGGEATPGLTLKQRPREGEVIYTYNIAIHYTLQV